MMKNEENDKVMDKNIEILLKKLLDNKEFETLKKVIQSRGNFKLKKGV